MTRCSPQRLRQLSSTAANLRVAQDGGSGKATRPRRMRRWTRFSALVSTAATLFCAACGGSSPTVLVAFRTEEQAQTHCPKDTVVWIDPQSATYYLKGRG